MLVVDSRYNGRMTVSKYIGFAGSAVSITRHWTTYLFYTYLAVLVWLPLPLASRPQWAVAFFNMWVAGMSLAALAGILAHPAAVAGCVPPGALAVVGMGAVLPVVADPERCRLFHQSIPQPAIIPADPVVRAIVPADPVPGGQP